MLCKSSRMLSWLRRPAPLLLLIPLKSLIASGRVAPLPDHRAAAEGPRGPPHGAENPGLLDDAKPIDARGRESRGKDAAPAILASSQLRATEWSGSFDDEAAYGRNWMAF